MELRYSFGYTDVDAWARLTGVTLEPWEVAVLIDLSNRYGIAHVEYQAKKYDLYPPYDGRTPEQIAQSVADKFDNAFGDLD